MDHVHALPAGTRLEEFEIVRVLGVGGFGITYLGYDHLVQRPVAIKEYLPNELAVRDNTNTVVAKSSSDTQLFTWGLTRFLDEARTLARFNHEHIIRVYRYFEAHGTAYIAMEYAEGETLGDYLKRAGELDQATLLALLEPLLRGLQKVHAEGVLHRDIKPENIILRAEDGSPVLLDFGAARQAIGSKTKSLTAIATPGYAPIEQYATNGRHGPWTDIYALGGVCYRCITGQRPPDAADRVRQDPIRALASEGIEGYSTQVLQAVDTALAFEEDLRPPDIDTWQAMLGLDGDTGRAGIAVAAASASAAAAPPPVTGPVAEDAPTPLPSGRSGMAAQDETELVPPPEAQPRKGGGVLLPAMLGGLVVLVGVAGAWFALGPGLPADDNKVVDRGDDPSNERIEERRDDPAPVVPDIDPGVAELVVRSNVAGDELMVDGRMLGATGPTAIELEPGLHSLLVAKPGYEPWIEQVELVGGERTVLSARLEPLEGTDTTTPVRSAVSPSGGAWVAFFEEGDGDFRYVTANDVAGFRQEVARLQSSGYGLAEMAVGDQWFGALERGHCASDIEQTGSWGGMRKIVQARWADDYGVQAMAHHPAHGWVAAFCQPNPGGEAVSWGDVDEMRGHMSGKMAEGQQLARLTWGADEWYGVFEENLCPDGSELLDAEDWSSLRRRIRTFWGYGYVVQDLAWGDGGWAAVMCKQARTDGFEEATSLAELQEKVRSRAADGWRLRRVMQGSAAG